MTRSRLSLLDQLEIIDAAMLDGSSRRRQEKRGQALVTLADAAPIMLKALRISLPLMEEFTDMGDSKTIRRAARQIRKAIDLAEGRED